jgi:hypothetical protein
MFLQAELTIPANTPIAQPVRQDIPALKGTIIWQGVLIPWGHGGLAGFQLWYNETQLIPFSRGKWLFGNDILYHIPDYYQLDSEPFVLTALGYNLDDTYEHSFLYLGIIIDIELTALERMFLTSIGAL